MAKCCKTRKYSLVKFANFSYYCVTYGNCYHSKVVTISPRNAIMRLFANFVRLYFPHIKTIFNQILEFYYFLKAVTGNLSFFTRLKFILLCKLSIPSWPRSLVLMNFEGIALSLVGSEAPSSRNVIIENKVRYYTEKNLSKNTNVLNFKRSISNFIAQTKVELSNFAMN